MRRVLKQLMLVFIFGRSRVDAVGFDLLLRGLVGEVHRGLSLSYKGRGLNPEKNF